MKTQTKKKTSKHKNRTFKNNDFYSGDGFVTSIWGPAQWHILHTISFNYPVNPTHQQKEQYKQYLLSLQHVLPCGACRKNLTKNFKRLPPNMCHFKNRDTFSKYIYQLHELVNKMLHKKSTLTYCDVRERYEHFRARCTTNEPIIPIIKKKTLKKLKKLKKEKGCTEPLYGKKARCIINIVPQENKGQSIQINPKCIKQRTD